VDDSGVARLRLQPAPDEADGLPVLLTWSGVQAVRFGPYNDEGLGFHPLYDSGSLHCAKSVRSSTAAG